MTADSVRLVSLSGQIKPIESLPGLGVRIPSHQPR